MKNNIFEEPTLGEIFQNFGNSNLFWEISSDSNTHCNFYGDPDSTLIGCAKSHTPHINFGLQGIADNISSKVTVAGMTKNILDRNNLFEGQLKADHVACTQEILEFSTDQMGTNISKFESGNSLKVDIISKNKEQWDHIYSTDLLNTTSIDSYDEVISDGWIPPRCSEMDAIINMDKDALGLTFGNTAAECYKNHELMMQHPTTYRNTLEDGLPDAHSSSASSTWVCNGWSAPNTDAEGFHNSACNLDTPFAAEMEFIEQNGELWASSNSIHYSKIKSEDPYLITISDEWIPTIESIPDVSTSAGFHESELSNIIGRVETNRLNDEGYTAISNTIKGQFLFGSDTRFNQNSLMYNQAKNQTNIGNIEAIFFPLTHDFLRPVFSNFAEDYANSFNFENEIKRIDLPQINQFVISEISNKGSFNTNDSVQVESILEDDRLLDKIAKKIMDKFKSSNRQSEFYNDLNKINPKLSDIFSGAVKNYEFKIDNYSMNVAHSLRELISITLRKLAPKKEVLIWLNNRENKLNGVLDSKGGPTRRGKIFYLFRNHSKRIRRIMTKETDCINELYNQLNKPAHTLPEDDREAITMHYLETTKIHLHKLMSYFI